MILAFLAVAAMLAFVGWQKRSAVPEPVPL
jgi:hypothetical protein